MGNFKKSTFRVFHSLLFLLHVWPFAEFFTLFFSACVNPKNLVASQVLKWLLYHHKFPKIPLNIELATLNFFMKNWPFLANWKSQNRNFVSQKRVFTTILDKIYWNFLLEYYFILAHQPPSLNVANKFVVLLGPCC